MAIKFKTCSCCNQRFSTDKFGKNSHSPDGLHWYTREHAAAKQREWKAANQEKVKKWRRDYIKRLKRQNHAATRVSAE